MLGVQTYRLELRLKEEFTNELSSNTSSKFRDFKRRMETAMKKVHENNNAYRHVQILRLRNGSIIADLLLTFSDKNTEGLTELFDAIRNNSFGDFPVDPDALTVIVIGTCPSDKCPGNSTCQQLTAETISCPCNKGYYYDGVNCIEFTVIRIEVSLQKVFTNDLKNSSSEEYKRLERNITAELYEKFKDTPNFQDVRVLGFRNGSTIVEFEVIYRKDDMTKTIVGENFRKRIIETGTLGGYNVTGGLVKGTPPAPDELKHTEVTENRIEIQWKKPKAHLAFDIDGYAIGHRTTAETKYKMEKFNNEITNSVLSNLESDTYYIITIHAYNDEGSGKNLEITVTTKKSSSSPVVIIIVVVIVVVLLLIIGMVVVFKLRKRRYHQEAREQAHAHSQMPTTMKLASIPSSKTHYDNHGQRDEEGQRSQKL